MDRETLSDEQVVQAVLQGDRQKYALLVDRYKGLAFGLAYRLLGDPDEAEEVVQESFVAAYMRLDRLARPDRFGSWVATIARNFAFSTLRKRGKAPASLEAMSEKGFDAAADPDESAEKEEQLTALRKAVAQLPPRQREILELRYTDGYSCDRIAAFLNTSVSSAKVRLFRARKKVLAILKKEGWA